MRRLSGIIIPLLLVAACGSTSESGSTTGAPTTAEVTTTVGVTSTVPDTTVPGTIVELPRASQDKHKR